jgi:hypothetical protein
MQNLIGTLQFPQPDPNIAARAFTLRGMIDQQAREKALGAQQLQLGDLAVQQHQRAAQDDITARRIAAEHMQNAAAAPAGVAQGAAPNSTQGMMALADKYQQAGLLPQAQALREHVLKQQKEMSGIDLDKAHAQLYGTQSAKERSDLAEKATSGFLLLPEDQQAAAWPQFRSEQIRHGNMNPEDAPEQYPGTPWLTHEHNQLAGANAIHEAQTKQAEEARKAALALPQLANAKNEAAISGVRAGQFANGGMDLKDTKTLEGQAQAHAEAGRHNRVGEAQGAARIGIERGRLNLQEALMAPDDEGTLDMKADAIHAGVPVSQIVRGRGNAADAQLRKIQARVAEKYPGFNWAQALSGYRADSGSLTSLQKNRDAVVAFENTAGKNLDQFLNAAKNVVDTGSPLLNTPVRLVTDKMAGNTNVTAFNTARQVALTEIAKVLTNPGLGGQLSDSARHEVEGLIGKDATLKQIYTAANILKTDMKNRRDSLDSQLGEIRGRIGGAPPAAAGPGAVPGVENWVRDATGKLVKQ